MKLFTEKSQINKFIPKNALLENTKASPSTITTFNEDIKKIRIINQLSPSTIHIDEGKAIKSIFFIEVELKHKEYRKSSIQLLDKLINQSKIMVLTFENEYKIVVNKVNLIESKWSSKEEIYLQIEGLNLDKVYENFIRKIGNIEAEENKNIEDQIKQKEEKDKLIKQIQRLEKQAYKETQPRKKFELKKEIDSLKQKIEDNIHG